MKENFEIREQISDQITANHDEVYARILKLTDVGFSPALGEHSLLGYLVDGIRLSIDLQESADEDLAPILQAIHELVARVRLA